MKQKTERSIMKAWHYVSTHFIVGFFLGFIVTLLGILVDDILHRVYLLNHFLDPVHYIVPTFSGILFGSLAIMYAHKEDKKKKAEQDLIESEKRFRLFYENSPLSYQSLDKNGVVMEVNDAWMAEMEYQNKDDVLGRSFDSFVDESQKKLFKKRFGMFKQVGHVTGIEWKVITNLGNEKYILLDGKMSYIDGQPYRSYCVFRNITEERKVEMAIIESEKKFRSYFENCPVSVYVVNSEGYFQDINPAAEELFDYSKTEFLTKTIGELIDVGMSEAYDPSKHDIFEIGKISTEVVLRKKNGSMVHGVLNAVKLSDNQVLGFITDITVQKETEIKLNESRERLNRLERMDTVFRLGGTLAHDINNILTILGGNASLSRRKLRVILKNNELLHNIIREPNIDKNEIEKIVSNDLLSLNIVLKYQNEINTAVERGGRHTSRLLRTTKHLDLNLKVYDHKNLNQLLEEAISFCFKSDSKIEVKRNYTDFSANIRIDFDIVANSVLNLIINAIDSIENIGIINIDVEEYNSPENDKSYIRIGVKDNGSGILEEHQNKIFEPFFTTKADGFGIGLSSSYDQIQKMGGMMDFVTKFTEGSQFNIYLPTISEPVVSIPEHDIDTIQYKGTILVVDDQEQIRSLMKQRLELKGFNVITAENGLVAYNILENRSKEIIGILSDIRMPVMRGTELYEKTISKYPQVKFVMMTGYFDEITDEGQFQNVLIIKKPILGDDLVKICDELQQK